MRKFIYLFSLLALLAFVKPVAGQGLENFNNYAGSSGTYTDGTFIGQDGSTWTYKQSRSDRAIVSPSPCMGKSRNPTAMVESGMIANGCGTLSFDYKQGFSTAVNLNVYVNGLLIGNVTSPGGNADTSIVHNSGPLTANVAGSFILKFKQADSTASGQVTIDNITWTANNTINPEPSNYPGYFIATPSNFKITLTWTDATGAQAPTAYLIKASITNNITAPVDGTPVSDDPNLSDGSAALNILQGTETCYFSGLQSNVQYFFTIYPYTNSGTIINFKTDGTAPSITGTTPNTAIIHQQNFNTYAFSPWTRQNITGAQEWVIDSIHGTSGSACARISGYVSGASNVNEDWLISPAMNFDTFTNEVLTFESAYNYLGAPLQVKISNNYAGTGDPNDYNWNDLTANWSPGGWVWLASGEINISATNGTAVYLAFTYTSDAANASTWEVDDILVMGSIIVGTHDQKEAGFSIYPNPAKDYVNMKFENNFSREISIVNLLGNTISQVSSSSTSMKLDVSGITPGVYFVKVVEEGKTYTKKMVIR